MCALVLITACGSAAPPAGTPAATPAGTDATAATPVPQSPTPGTGTEEIAAVDFDETDDPGAAAQRELDLTSELRTDAEMAALIGESGEAAFADLDAIASEFAQPSLEELAELVDTGELAAMIAAVHGAPGGSGPLLVGAIDLNVFTQTGFTASAILQMATGIIQRADEGISGSVPRQDHRESTANGLRQVVDLSMTWTVQAGGGRVTAEVTMSATDSIFDAASGSFVALYTSTTDGRFEVEACPDESGVAEGTYTFETRHEMNDVSGAANARSGASRAVDAPFQIVNGDDAHLLRIEATLDLAADAFGTDHDWNAAQTVPIVLTPGASTTVGIPTSASAEGSGSERSAGSMFVSSAMAQLLLSQIGKEAETFWRSGKCIELTPSRDTDTVKPNEEIELSVTSEGRFQPGAIEKPITATFSGTESLDPVGEPVPYPPTFNFVAGPNRDDVGTIDLEQVSNRGIGKRRVIYTVGEGYRISMDGQMGIDSANSFEITVAEQELVAQDDGSYMVETDAVFDGTVGLPGCTVNVSKSLPIRITVRPDADSEPPTANLRVDPVSGGQLDGVPVTCGGATTLAPVPIFLWALSFNTTTAPGRTVQVDEPTTLIAEAAAAAGAEMTTVVNLTTAE